MIENKVIDRIEELLLSLDHEENYDFSNAVYDEIEELENRYPGIIRAALIKFSLKDPVIHAYGLLRLLRLNPSSNQELYLIASSTKIDVSYKITAIESIIKTKQVSALKKLTSYLEDQEADPNLQISIIIGLSKFNLKEYLSLIRNFDIKRFVETSKSLSRFDPEELILKCRACLGDEDVLVDLIKLKFRPEQRIRPRLARDLTYLDDLIIFMGGFYSVLDKFSPNKDMEIKEKIRHIVLNEVDPFIRSWVLKKYYELDTEIAIELALQIIGSQYDLVNQTANTILLKTKPIQELKEIYGNDANNPYQRIIALYLLLALDEPIQKSMQISTYPIALDSLIPEEVRDAIVRFWVPLSRDGTDFRWLLENKLHESNFKGNLRKREILKDKIQCLLKENLEFIEIGIRRGGGGRGTYYVLVDPDFDEFTNRPYSIAVSKICDYASVAQTPYGGNEKTLNKIKEIVLSCGFSILESQLSNIEIPKLKISQFGQIESKTVGELLFYWQD